MFFQVEATSGPANATSGPARASATLGLADLTCTFRLGSHQGWLSVLVLTSIAYGLKLGTKFESPAVEF